MHGNIHARLSGAGTATRSAISSVNLTDAIKAQQAIESIDSALNQITAIRGTLAANSKAFEHAINTNTSVSAAKSKGLALLEDADMLKRRGWQRL